MLLLAITVLVMAVRFYSMPMGSEDGGDDPAVTAALEKRNPEVRFVEAAFADTLDYLEDSSGLRIRVNWSALGAEGVTPTTPVTLHMRDVRFEKQLWAVLIEVGAGTARLGFEADADGILISTERALLSAVETRRYDIRDLITARDGTYRLEIADAVCTLIMDICASDSWKTTGGEFADIQHKDGFLVVTQTRPVHRSVHALMQQLRATRSQPLRILTAEYSSP